MPGASSGNVTSRKVVRGFAPRSLLWGRRENMCTKPMEAKPADGMYSWTRQILQDQISLALRTAHADAAQAGPDAARRG
jgi:hypothetical protein